MPELIMISDLKDPNDPQGRSYREINNAMVHTHEVGQLVELESGARVFIAMQTRDCDGTPLYCLTPEQDDYQQQCEGRGNPNWLNGHSEEDFKAV